MNSFVEYLNLLPPCKICDSIRTANLDEICTDCAKMKFWNCYDCYYTTDKEADFHRAHTDKGHKVGRI